MTISRARGLALALCLFLPGASGLDAARAQNAPVADSGPVTDSGPEVVSGPHNESGQEADGPPRSILPPTLIGKGADSSMPAPNLRVPDFTQAGDSDEGAVAENETGGASANDISLAPAEEDPGILIGGDVEVDELDPATPGDRADADRSVLTANLWDANLWKESDGATVRDLLGVANPGASLALQDLTRSMLLVDALPPNGLSEDEFLAARLSTLARMGDLEAVLTLVNRAGTRLDAPGAERVKLDAYLLAEDFLGACAYAGRELRSQADPYWLEVMTFCRALDGDRAGANLSLELLQERAVEAPVFYKLIAALLASYEADKVRSVSGPQQKGESLVIASMPAPSALLISMAAILRADLPADVIEGASPLVRTRLAGLPTLDLSLRLDAAWRAAREGGFPHDRLAQVFGAVDFRDDELANATLIAEITERDRADALLYQAALSASAGEERAIALVAGAKQARSSDTLGLYASVNREALVTLPPGPGTISLAPELVRLLLLAGERDVALAWYRHVRDAGLAGDGEARAALVAMWPLVVIGAGGTEVPVSGEILDLWWQGRTQAMEAESALQARLLYGFFDALGHGIPDAFWPEMASSTETPGAPTATPSLPVWRGLLKAAAEGNAGDAGLHTLAALSGFGPGGVAPEVIISVVRSLKAAGLEEYARAIALEAMVAHGL